MTGAPYLPLRRGVVRVLVVKGFGHMSVPTLLTFLGHVR